MKQLGLVVLGIFAAASLASSVLAEDGHTNRVDRPGRPNPMERFTKADTDKDGKLSLAEFKAAFPKGKLSAEERFAKADVNPKDGFVTPEELKAVRRERKAGATDTPAK